MRQYKFWLFAMIALAVVSSGVRADHRHWRPHGFYSYHRSPSFGFYLGWPWYPRPYYAYPYYPYYPPVVTVPSSPPVYIEREPPQLPSGYWYYCDNPQGYYPYVNECPQGWRQVDPVPQR
jgi:hypothetical protein